MKVGTVVRLKFDKLRIVNGIVVGISEQGPRSPEFVIVQWDGMPFESRHLSGELKEVKLEAEKGIKELVT
jgi:hypothetical protein